MPKLLTLLTPSMGWTLTAFIALLGIPRVVLHDLRLVEFDSVIYLAATFIPYVIWLGFVLTRDTKTPFRDYVILGLVFGLFLSVTHQLLWAASWGDFTPKIGGNLEGVLPPAIESILLRTFAFLSSIMTGLVVGVILGIIGYIAQAARLKRNKK